MPQPKTLVFAAPGPGSWALDNSHCPRPRSVYLNELFVALFTAGFREGFAHYGILLDTLEGAVVNNFFYISPRPLGAPPEAKVPPKMLFKLLVRLHPTLRQRIKRAEEVIDQKLWRQDGERFYKEQQPAFERRLLALQSARPEELSLSSLAEHLEAARRLVIDDMREHFRSTCAAMLPVGDFLAHVSAWTGCSTGEALATLKGFSPDSVEMSEEMKPVLSAISLSEEARAILSQKGDAAHRLSQLRALPVIGEALSVWLTRAGYRIASGYDITEMYMNEMPELLLGILGATQREATSRRTLDAENAAFALRVKVPAAARATFDELLAEARDAYRLRDARAATDYWAFGLLRRALLEVGRRLMEKDALNESSHVFALRHQEVLDLLHNKGPSKKELAAEVTAQQLRINSHQAPRVLGPAPSKPPSDWLPTKAARLARALDTYMSLMYEQPILQEKGVIRGLAASAGVYKGRARLIQSPDDFAHVQKGDVLIAITTTPAYNVIFPLVGAVVTDFGGLLSHPAIVSREYGLPAVIGTQNATLQIPDGAVVEVDGSAGTVRFE